MYMQKTIVCSHIQNLRSPALITLVSNLPMYQLASDHSAAHKNTAIPVSIQLCLSFQKNSYLSAYLQSSSPKAFLALLEVLDVFLSSARSEVRDVVLSSARSEVRDVILSSARSVVLDVVLSSARLEVLDVVLFLDCAPELLSLVILCV